MKIEHYHVTTPKRPRWRFWKWRILDDEGVVIARGEKMHETREGSQHELNDVLDFLEAWSRERVQHGPVW